MRTVEKWEDIRETTPCALALGAFDGLHRGHLAVIAAAAEQAGEMGVFTFESSPSGAPMLITREDKREILKKAGVKRLFSLRFADVKDLPAEDFFRELVRRCRVTAVCCGEDFRFGRGAAGDAALLKKLCRETGVGLAVVPPVTEDGEKISSTRIRAAVEAGDIPLANRLLGRPFGFAMEVIHGNHLGTGMGTPTINQEIPEHFALPPFGVYAALCRVDGADYYGVTNIGVKPTVGSDRVLAETWMPDFSGDAYGKKVRLMLWDFIRPERKFTSLDELKAEIQKNAAEAGEIVKKTLQSRKTVIE